MEMKAALTVKTKSSSYPVYIQEGSIDAIAQCIQSACPHHSSIVVISDQNVARHYLEKVETQLKELNSQILSIVLPPGEHTKSMDVLYPCFEKMIRFKADRKCVVVALGGGVIGDAAGFIAATYLRGVSFIQVPTSLLAMVDSSIGGKVGINHELGKNLIGAFYPPQAVLIDTKTLQTLPSREFKSGLAECVKHALIDSDTLLDWTAETISNVLELKPESLKELLIKNLSVKQHHVEHDEFEAGIRAFLNFGHTFAHALEKITHHELIHGEAVGLGLLAALKLSELSFGLPSEILPKVTHLLSSIGLPIKSELPAFEIALESMQRDKKNAHSKITFVVLEKVGTPSLHSHISEDAIHEAYSLISA